MKWRRTKSLHSKEKSIHFDGKYLPSPCNCATILKGSTYRFCATTSNYFHGCLYTRIRPRMSLIGVISFATHVPSKQQVLLGNLSIAVLNVLEMKVKNICAPIASLFHVWIRNRGIQAICAYYRSQSSRYFSCWVSH